MRRAVAPLTSVFIAAGVLRGVEFSEASQTPLVIVGRRKKTKLCGGPESIRHVP